MILVGAVDPIMDSSLSFGHQLPVRLSLNTTFLLGKIKGFVLIIQMSIYNLNFLNSTLLYLTEWKCGTRT